MVRVGAYYQKKNTSSRHSVAKYCQIVSKDYKWVWYRTPESLPGVTHKERLGTFGHIWEPICYLKGVIVCGV